MEKKITTVREPARDIPVRASADILIVGGGPAGLMAAQAAAGEGLKVMLIESRGYLAGTSRSGSRSWDSWGRKATRSSRGSRSGLSTGCRSGAPRADTDPASST